MLGLVQVAVEVEFIFSFIFKPRFLYYPNRISDVDSKKISRIMHTDEEAGAQRYVPKATPYHALRDRTKANRNGWQDPILEEEKRWEKDRDDRPKLETQSSNQPAQQSAPEQPEDDDADPPEGEGAQCQCC